MKLKVALLIAQVLVPLASHAQWEKQRDPAVARRSSVEVNLSAPVPRVAGKPDLSGVWLADFHPLPEGMPTVEIDLSLPKHMINVAADLPPDALPIQPWAAKLLDERLASGGTIDPVAHCKPSGMPLLAAAPLPFKIVQTGDLVVILYEENNVFRQIFMNGRKPAEDAEPRYLGYSMGRWEGDDLVVDTVGFSDFHWLDAMGHPLTEQLHLIERYRRIDAGHLAITITIDDPGAYTSPFDYTITATLQPEDDLLEYFCSDFEQDAQHYQ